MPQYLLRFLDGDGRLIGRAYFQAMNHDEAQRAAEDLGDNRRKELWCDGRRVWASTAAQQRRPAPPVRRKAGTGTAFHLRPH